MSVTRLVVIGGGLIGVAAGAFILASVYRTGALALVGCAALCGVFVVHQLYVWEGDFHVPAKLGLVFGVLVLGAAGVELVNR